MKLLLISTLLLSTAFAEDKDKGAKLEEIKARLSARINQRIALEQSHLACIQSAQTKDALKECQKTHHESMKKLHQENKEERKGREHKKKP